MPRQLTQIVDEAKLNRTSLDTLSMLWQEVLDNKKYYPQTERDHACEIILGYLKDLAKSNAFTILQFFDSLYNEQQKEVKDSNSHSLQQ